MILFKRYRRMGRKVSKATFYEFKLDEEPVYTKRELGIIKEGVVFKITGNMAPYCERFAIQLILDNPTNDVALRLNTLLPQNYVVRNSRLNNIWGIDEDSSVLPFTLKRGADFVIQVLITKDRFMISLNGGHFAKFNHRISYKSLARIEVYGDVRGIRLDQSVVTEYPDRLNKLLPIKIQTKMGRSVLFPFNRITLKKNTEISLPLPYYGILGKNSLIYGQQLRFEGRVKLLPWSFYINLQKGRNIWPHPIVPFHFRCRFAKHRDYIGRNVVTQNAWYNGHWAEEEVSELTTDLTPAKTFSLIIIRGLDSYEVYVNRKFITKFAFRLDPNIADTVYILGDIKLWVVVLEDNNIGI